MEELKTEKQTLRKTYMTSDKRGQKEMLEKIDYDRNYMINLKKGEDLTKFKHEFYKDLLETKEALLNTRTEKRGKFGWITKQLNPFIEQENEVEIVRLENEIHTNGKMVSSYGNRVKEDEQFIEKVGEEANNHFAEILEEAKGIVSNLRLQDAINGFEKKQNEGLVNQRSKIEFYLFMKSEIKNNIVHGK